MYFFIAITSFLKTLSPYFRKNILVSLESHEYLFLNTFFVALFVLMFFLYKLFFHDTFLDKIVYKIQNLTISQVFYFMLIAFITVTSSMVFINLDKDFNAPLTNALLSKVIAAIMLAAVGFFIYTEQYNVKQIFGIFLTIVGLFLISCKN